MPCQCSPCFLVLPMLLVWYCTTQWSSGTAPMLLTGHCARPVVTWWFTASAMDLWNHFLLSSIFYLAVLPAFSRLPQGRQYNLKVSRLHADLQNITPAQLFVWITAIHKRFICSRFYLRARAGQSQNINLHRELVLRNICFEISFSYGIWTLFVIGEPVTSLLSQPLSHRALQIEINYLETIQNLVLS